MKKSILAFLILIVMGCGSREHAGGSGMEIPNAITMVVIQGNGDPVINGMVKIVAESKWMHYAKYGDPVVLDSMSTNTQGEFSFEYTDEERVRIEVVSDGEGASVIFDTSRSTIELAPLGSIQAQWLPGAKVMIMGTSFSQIADENGHLNFSSIPSIHSGLIGIQDGQSPAVISPVFLNSYESLQLGELQVVKDGLLIDDFESMEISTQLEPFVHGSYWFSIADENEGGDSRIVPSTANGNSWLLGVSDSAAKNGNSLTVNFQVKSSTSQASYAIFGCALGNGLNVNAIDSIQFNAYSDGKFVLTDGSVALMHGLPNSTSGWSTFTVSRSDLDSLGVNPMIYMLQFVFTDTSGSVFRLDDFFIYGDPFELLQNE